MTRVTPTTRRLAVSKSATTSAVPGATASEGQPKHQAAAADEADSCDSLLNESFGVWQQLTGEAGLCQEPAETPCSQPFTGLQPSDPCSLMSSMSQDGDIALMSATEQSLQLKQAKRATMHGASLLQLLEFVQLVQQHSSGVIPAQQAEAVQGSGSSPQLAAIDRIARMCSQHKQANMAYTGIGNSKHWQQSGAPAQTAVLPRFCAIPDNAALVQGHPASSWQPRGVHMPLSVWDCCEQGVPLGIADKNVLTLLGLPTVITMIYFECFKAAVAPA